MAEPSQAGVTISAALAQGTASLADVGCETPRFDAEVLLAEALGLGRTQLVLRARDPLTPEALAAFARLLTRRIAREPVAYITGRRAFRRLWLHVDPRVLIPRPESELLVEVGLTLPRCSLVADVGTGSGAVALALADERPDLRVVGIDLSADALELARANGRRLGLSQVEWVLADLLDGRPYDAVLANLPYVADGEPLAPEIAEYEPAAALYAGADGLEVIRRLVELVDPQLSLLALEVGAGQAGAVSALLARAGFRSADRLRDLAGFERVVVGRR